MSPSPLLQPFLQYVIFPAQFAFLYSYYPSGRMPEIAESLEARWKVQHEIDAEAEFKAKEDGFVRKSGPSFFQKVETVLAAKKDE